MLYIGILFILYLSLFYYFKKYKAEVQKESSIFVYLYIYLTLISSTFMLSLKSTLDFSYVECFIFWSIYLLMLLQLVLFFVNIYKLRKNNLYLLEKINIAFLKTIFFISILEVLHSYDITVICSYVEVLENLILGTSLKSLKLSFFIEQLVESSYTLKENRFLTACLYNHIIDLYVILIKIPITGISIFFIFLSFLFGYGFLLLFILFWSFGFSFISLIFSSFDLFLLLNQESIFFVNIFIDSSQRQEFILKEGSSFLMKELEGNVDLLKNILGGYFTKIGKVNQKSYWDEQKLLEQELKKIYKYKDKPFTIKGSQTFLKKFESLSQSNKFSTYGNNFNKAVGIKSNYFLEMSRLHDICISQQQSSNMYPVPVITEFSLENSDKNPKDLLTHFEKNIVSKSKEITSLESNYRKEKQDVLNTYQKTLDQYCVDYKIGIETIAELEFSKVKFAKVENNDMISCNKWLDTLNYTDIVLSNKVKKKRMLLNLNQTLMCGLDYLNVSPQGFFKGEVQPLHFLNIANCRMHNVFPIVDNLRLEVLENPLHLNFFVNNAKQVNLLDRFGTKRIWGDLVFSVSSKNTVFHYVGELKNLSRLAFLNQIHYHGLDLVNFLNLPDSKIQTLENHTFTWYSSQIYNSFVKFQKLAPEIQDVLQNQYAVGFYIGLELTDIQKSSLYVYSSEELATAYFEGFCKKLNYEIKQDIGDVPLKKKLLIALQNKNIFIKFIKY